MNWSSYMFLVVHNVFLWNVFHWELIIIKPSVLQSTLVVYVLQGVLDMFISVYFKLTDDWEMSLFVACGSRCEWSCSGPCSEASDRVLTERLASILARGARAIKTEVWTWGSVQRGQLGTGDMVRRHRWLIFNN